MRDFRLYRYCLKSNNMGCLKELYQILGIRSLLNLHVM